MNYLDCLPNEILFIIFEYVIDPLEYESQLVYLFLIEKKLIPLIRQVFKDKQRYRLKTVKGVYIPYRREYQGTKNYLPDHFKDSMSCNVNFRLEFFDLSAPGLNHFSSLVYPLKIENFSTLQNLYDQYWCAHPAYFQQPFTVRMNEQEIRDWNTIAWNHTAVRIVYPISEVHSAFIQRQYEKEGFFTFKDLIDRIYYFYSQPLVKEEVRMILEQSRKLPIEFMTDLLEGQLMGLQLVERLNAPLHSYFSIKLWNQIITFAPYSYLARLPSIEWKRLNRFLGLSQSEQFLVTIFATDVDSFLNPDAFIKHFWNRVEEGGIIRKELLGDFYKNSIFYMGGSFANVWTIGFPQQIKNSL